MSAGSAELRVAAVLDNVHAYYRQFVPLVEASIKESLVPVEKALKVCNAPAEHILHLLQSYTDNAI